MRDISPASAAFAISLLIPLLISFISPLFLIFGLPEFAPPQIIYSKDVLPLIFAPWAYPNDFNRVLSRVIQTLLLFRLPKTSIVPCYLSWIAIGLLRTLIGFLLSRSVGWAYPHLFNHWALYESCSGLGPALVTYLLTSGPRPCLDFALAHLRGRRWEATELLVVLGVCTGLAWLDNAPWTYGTAIVLSLAFNTLGRTRCASSLRENSYTAIAGDSQSPPRRLRTDVQLAIISLALLPLPTILTTVFATPLVLQMPTSPTGGSPLLEIIILSYPRPNDSSSSASENSLLSQTISSYLPYVDSNTALSVFTHATANSHPSFQHAQSQFNNAPVTFYTDTDTHPDAYTGQYLHVSEAFRWASQKVDKRAEWIMLVEDDFPLCGAWGWAGALGVMTELERGRTGMASVKRWGGFVGTGGSGLIIHYTLLPILTHTLRLHASMHSSLPPSLPRRPTDIIIQDCLLGADPLCPGASSGSSGGTAYGESASMVITSRLVMDHIGGDASTAKGRKYDLDKWRCGWRHPFHGRPEVTVVPV